MREVLPSVLCTCFTVVKGASAVALSLDRERANLSTAHFLAQDVSGITGILPRMRAMFIVASKQYRTLL